MQERWAYAEWHVLGYSSEPIILPVDLKAAMKTRFLPVSVPDVQGAEKYFRVIAADSAFEVVVRKMCKSVGFSIIYVLFVTNSKATRKVLPVFEAYMQKTLIRLRKHLFAHAEN